MTVIVIIIMVPTCTNHTEFDISGPVFSLGLAAAVVLGSSGAPAPRGSAAEPTRGRLEGLGAEDLGTEVPLRALNWMGKTGKNREKPMDLETMGQFFQIWGGFKMI